MQKLRDLGPSRQARQIKHIDDDRLHDCDGYCDWTTHEIVVEREIQGNWYDMDAYVKKVKRR